MTADAGPERLDGRTVRSRHTRDRIVAATLSLVEAGPPRPTSRHIADAAGISERTLFLHFPDLESLHAAVSEHHLEVSVRHHRPVDPRLPLPERVHRFAHRRGRRLERLTPLRRVAILYEQDSPALRRSRQRWNALARRELEHTFAAELRDKVDGPSTVAAAQAATSWAVWEELRTGQGLSFRAAIAAMELTLRRVLTT